MTAHLKLLISLLIGVSGAAVSAALGAGRMAPLIGWDVLALSFCVWVWASVWRLDSARTATHARREDPGRDLADALLLGASIASLVAIGLVLFGASHAVGNLKYLQTSLAMVSVFLSWVLVHTLFTVKYARLYYSDPDGGVDFNQDQEPQYSDFAYLAFTIGMTFQVSDTDIQTKEIRRTALRHALLSYPLGVVIIAAAINLVSGLAK
jgi:uncharacterized membrane protein